MNNLKQFFIWWSKESTQAIHKSWPGIRFRLFQFFDFMSALILAALALLAIVAAIGYYVSTSGPWIYFSTLAKWAITPVLYLTWSYFNYKWHEWKREQEKLLNTLSQKSFK